MKRSVLDVFGVVILGLTLVALVLTHVDLGIFRFAVGLLLVFALPGYILSVALFPHPIWPILERIMLMIGLSLSISVLGGSILYVFAVPLKAESWAVFFGSIIFLAGSAAIFRRIRMGQIPARRKTDTIAFFKGQFSIHPGQVLLFGLAALIVLSAIALAQKVAATQPQTEIVQLWILPAESKNGPNIRLGAMANEFAPREYTLWLERGGYTIQIWRRLVLKPGERWETVVPIDANLPGTGPLQAYLYRYDEPEAPYRYVIFWLDQLQE